MKNILDQLGAEVLRIVINDLQDNTFYATLVLKQDEKQIEVDCRPSDAIALAVRAKAPIFAETA